MAVPGTDGVAVMARVSERSFEGANQEVLGAEVVTLRPGPVPGPQGTLPPS